MSLETELAKVVAAHKEEIEEANVRAQRAAEAQQEAERKLAETEQQLRDSRVEIASYRDAVARGDEARDDAEHQLARAERLQDNADDEASQYVQSYVQAAARADEARRNAEQELAGVRGLLADSNDAAAASLEAAQRAEEARADAEQRLARAERLLGESEDEITTYVEAANRADQAKQQADRRVEIAEKALAEEERLRQQAEADAVRLRDELAAFEQTFEVETEQAARTLGIAQERLVEMAAEQERLIQAGEGERVEELGRLRDDLATAVGTAKREAEQYETQHQRDQAEIERLTRLIGQRESTLGSTARDLDEAYEKISKQNTEMAVTRSSLAEAEAAVQELEQAVLRERARADQIERDLGDAGALAAKRQEEIDVLDGKLIHAEEELRAQYKRQGELEQAIKSQTHRLDERSGRVEALTNELAAVRANVEALDRARASAETGYAEQIQANEDIRATLLEEQVAVAKAQTTARDERERADRTAELLAQARQQVEDLTVALEDERDQHQRTKNALADRIKV